MTSKPLHLILHYQHNRQHFPLITFPSFVALGLRKCGWFVACVVCVFVCVSSWAPVHSPHSSGPETVHAVYMIVRVVCVGGDKVTLQGHSGACVCMSFFFLLLSLLSRIVVCISRWEDKNEWRRVAVTDMLKGEKRTDMEGNTHQYITKATCP